MQADGDIRQPLRLLHAFTTPKRPGTPNEDRWQSSDDGGTCAISDGASVSFDPAPWAQILVERFVADSTVSRTWLEAAVAQYQTGYDRDTMAWAQQAGYDRGSFATLLGVVFSSVDCSFHVVTFGDSLLALVNGTRLVHTAPYVSPVQFDAQPSLLSTNPLENAWCNDDAIATASFVLRIEFDQVPTVLLMTDALGRWLLDRPDANRVQALISIQDDEMFERFVGSERSEGNLRRDDSTLLILGSSK